MKILIGVPCGDTIKSRTAFSLMNLMKPSNSHLVMEMGIDVAHNRNKIAAQALSNDFTHLLFVDADMAFNPDALELLLAHDKDIISVAYNHRRLPAQTVIQPLEKADVHRTIPSELFEAKSVGTGLMLIKTDVLKKMKLPYFHFSYDEELQRVGEDVSFCLNARELGYQIWVDPTIAVRHIGEYLF